tara:strand:+ start:80 stop:478 length:399 start_codon:yes stop_codon:yes gene_type:complete
MSKTFQLDIVTPTQVISIGQVEYLRAPTKDGLFGIKSGHAPATITLDIGEIKITQNGKNSFYATNGGFADINSEGTLLLVETIESAASIDETRAQKAVKRAKSYLKDSSNDIHRAQTALNRAKNRLKISGKL